MTREEAIEVIEQDIPCEHDTDLIEALEMAIKALETLEEFEKAQIITGGRLNGRTYAYKCGLEDGKRKALEQEPVLDKIRAEIKALSPKPTAYDVVDGNPIKDAVWETLVDVLAIMDKYKA